MDVIRQDQNGPAADGWPAHPWISAAEGGGRSSSTAQTATLRAADLDAFMTTQPRDDEAQATIARLFAPVGPFTVVDVVTAEEI